MRLPTLVALTVLSKATLLPRQNVPLVNQLFNVTHGRPFERALLPNERLPAKRPRPAGIRQGHASNPSGSGSLTA